MNTYWVSKEAEFLRGIQKYKLSLVKMVPEKVSNKKCSKTIFWGVF
jgi:hypothetical protein